MEPQVKIIPRITNATLPQFYCSILDLHLLIGFDSDFKQFITFLNPCCSDFVPYKATGNEKGCPFCGSKNPLNVGLTLSKPVLSVEELQEILEKNLVLVHKETNINALIASRLLANAVFSTFELFEKPLFEQALEGLSLREQIENFFFKASKEALIFTL